jgi:hypothetical protein
MNLRIFRSYLFVLFHNLFIREGQNWAKAVRENRKDNAESDAGAL